MARYSVYHPSTYDILYVINADVQPANSTPLMVTQRWALPRYNPQTNTLYNAASTQQQADFIAQPTGAKILINDDGVFLKDDGDGTMRQINITNGVVGISDPIL